MLGSMGLLARPALGDGEAGRAGVECDTNWPGITYTLEIRTTPRPLRIHTLRVDLAEARWEVVAAAAGDPDGEGPAEARLTNPVALAQGQGLIAAVNANAFGGLPDSKGQRDSTWIVDKPVEICGWTVTNRVTVSPVQGAYWSFWTDPQFKPHIGHPDRPTPAREAVAGFEGLVVEGLVLPKPGGPLHPRTAIGVDATNRVLYCVVVDGRQPGFSEGLSSFELAELMKERGCWNALNFDGGGSSIMLLADGKGTLRIMNRPSDRSATGQYRTRPIPVMLGIRPALRQPPPEQ